MNSLTLLSLARALVDIDSTTGREGEVAEWVEGYLQRLGYTTERQAVPRGDDAPQEVARPRFNVFAARGPVDVVLSTHLDCVPPFIPSRVADGLLYGRGSCDAKGIAAAQIAAAERLRAAGVSGVGLLFVVGEERGSDGATVANGLAPGSRYLIDGEPTDNKLGVGHRGVLRLRLQATGRAAHSAYPHLGVSAIEKLLDALLLLRGLDLPSHELLGQTHYTIGMISGGVAPNVVPAQADAEVLFRTVRDGAELTRMVSAALGHLVEVRHVLELPPVTLDTVEGVEAVPVAFATDIPLLSAWGRPFLLGPGSIHVAHTADEHVPIAELERAVSLYTELVQAIVARDR